MVAYDADPVYYCMACDAVIYDGQIFYRLMGKPWCEGCVKSTRAYARKTC